MPESFADNYCASHKHLLLVGGILNFSTKQSLKVTFKDAAVSSEAVFFKMEVFASTLSGTVWPISTSLDSDKLHSELEGTNLTFRCVASLLALFRLVRWMNRYLFRIN